MNSTTQTTFILLFGAHFLGDVLFNTQKIALMKRSTDAGEQLRGFLVHCVVHSLIAGIFLFFAGRLWLKGCLLVLAAHFFIDLNRSKVEVSIYGPNQVFVSRSEFLAWISGKPPGHDKMNIKNLAPWVLINVFDQGLHLGSLYCIALMV